jgi:hypothetical protein
LQLIIWLVNQEVRPLAVEPALAPFDRRAQGQGDAFAMDYKLPIELEEHGAVTGKI